MFDLEAQIKRWREELARTGLDAREVVDELEGHLRERIDRLSASGYSGSEAFQMAVQQLGDGKALKPEFTKLKRGRLWIFRGNPLGLNVLAVWFVVIGLNQMIRPLCRLCFSFLDFVRVEPRWHPDIDLNLTLTGGFFILMGIGLLRRSKICRVVALAVALQRLYFDFYYFVLGHAMLGAPSIPLPASVVVRTMFLGLPVPYGFTYVRRYVGLAIMMWGVYALLRPLAGKLVRRPAAG